ncbi:MAG: hypothetical protein V1882_01285 [Candidatus Omnitrophota bacterium]
MTFNAAYINGVVYAWGADKGENGLTDPNSKAYWHSSAETGKNSIANSSMSDSNMKNLDVVKSGTAADAQKIGYDFSGTAFASMNTTDQNALGQFLATYGIGGMRLAGTYVYDVNGTQIGFGNAEMVNGVLTFTHAYINGVVYAYANFNTDVAGASERWIQIGNGDVKSVEAYSASVDLPGGGTALGVYMNVFTGAAAMLSVADQAALGAFMGMYGINGVKQAGVGFVFDAAGTQIGMIEIKGWSNGVPVIGEAAYINGVVYGWSSKKGVFQIADSSQWHNTTGKEGEAVVLDQDTRKKVANYAMDIIGFRHDDGTSFNAAETLAVGNFMAAMGLNGLIQAGKTALYLDGKFVGTGVVQWANGSAWIKVASINGVIYAWSAELYKGRGTGESSFHQKVNPSDVTMIFGEKGAINIVDSNNKQIADYAKEVTGFNIGDGFKWSTSETTTIGNFMAGLGLNGLVQTGMAALYLGGETGKLVGVGMMTTSYFSSLQIDVANVGGVVYGWSSEAKTFQIANPSLWTSVKTAEGFVAKDGTTFTSSETLTVGNFMAGLGLGGLTQAAGTYYQRTAVELGAKAFFFVQDAAARSFNYLMDKYGVGFALGAAVGAAIIVAGALVLAGIKCILVGGVVALGVKMSTVGGLLIASGAFLGSSVAIGCYYADVYAAQIKAGETWWNACRIAGQGTWLRAIQDIAFSWVAVSVINMIFAMGVASFAAGAANQVASWGWVLRTGSWLTERFGAGTGGILLSRAEVTLTGRAAQLWGSQASSVAYSGLRLTSVTLSGWNAFAIHFASGFTLRTIIPTILNIGVKMGFTLSIGANVLALLGITYGTPEALSRERLDGGWNSGRGNFLGVWDNITRGFVLMVASMQSMTGLESMMQNMVTTEHWIFTVGFAVFGFIPTYSSSILSGMAGMAGTWAGKWIGLPAGSAATGGIFEMVGLVGEGAIISLATFQLMSLIGRSFVQAWEKSGLAALYEEAFKENVLQSSLLAWVPDQYSESMVELFDVARGRKTHFSAEQNQFSQQLSQAVTASGLLTAGFSSVGGMLTKALGQFNAGNIAAAQKIVSSAIQSLNGQATGVAQFDVALSSLQSMAENSMAVIGRLDVALSNPESALAKLYDVPTLNTMLGLAKNNPFMDFGNRVDVQGGNLRGLAAAAAIQLVATGGFDATYNGKSAGEFLGSFGLNKEQVSHIRTINVDFAAKTISSEDLSNFTRDLAMSSGVLVRDVRGVPQISTQLFINVVMANFMGTLSAEAFRSSGVEKNALAAFEAMTPEARTKFQNALRGRSEMADGEALMFLMLGSQLATTPKDTAKVKALLQAFGLTSSSARGIAGSLGIMSSSARSILRMVEDGEEGANTRVGEFLIEKAGAFQMKDLWKFEGVLSAFGRVDAQDYGKFFSDLGLQGAIPSVILDMLTKDSVFADTLISGILDSLMVSGKRPTEAGLRDAVFFSALQYAKDAPEAASIVKAMLGEKGEKLGKGLERLTGVEGRANYELKAVQAIAASIAKESVAFALPLLEAAVQGVAALSFNVEALVASGLVTQDEIDAFLSELNRPQPVTRSEVRDAEAEQTPEELTEAESDRSAQKNFDSVRERLSGAVQALVMIGGRYAATHGDLTSEGLRANRATGPPASVTAVENSLSLLLGDILSKAEGENGVAADRILVANLAWLNQSFSSQIAALNLQLDKAKGLHAADRILYGLSISQSSLRIVSTLYAQKTGARQKTDSSQDGDTTSVAELEKESDEILRVLGSSRSTGSRLNRDMRLHERAFRANQNETRVPAGRLNQLVASVQSAFINSLLGKFIFEKTQWGVAQVLRAVAEEGRERSQEMLITALQKHSKWGEVSKELRDRVSAWQEDQKTGAKAIDPELLLAIYKDVAGKAIFTELKLVPKLKAKFFDLMLLFEGTVQSIQDRATEIGAQLELAKRLDGVTGEKARAEAIQEVCRAWQAEFQKRIDKEGLTKPLRNEALAFYSAAIAATKGDKGWADSQGNFRLHDEQIMAALVMNYGWNIAELATGEGKTTIGFLSAVVNGLTGNGSFIVTTQDMAAADGYISNTTVANMLGISVGLVQKNDYERDANKNAEVFKDEKGKSFIRKKGADMTSEQKRSEYHKQITYVSTQNWAFDTQNDILETKENDPGKKIIDRDFKKVSVIIDEIDSVLIDQAMTSFIRSSGQGEAKEEDKDLRLAFARIVGNVDVANEGDEFKLAVGQFLIVDGEAVRPLVPNFQADAIKDPTGRMAQANESGIAKAVKRLAAMLSEGNISPELFDRLVTPETKKGKMGLTLTKEGKDLLSDAVQAQHLYAEGRQYRRENNEILLVAKDTGVTQEGQRLNRLHQAIEAKEYLLDQERIKNNLEVENPVTIHEMVVRGESRTTSSVTARDVLRQYGRVSGMTGTASYGQAEKLFDKMYGLKVQTVPTHSISRRVDHPMQFMNSRERFERVAELVIEAIAAGRPVLINAQTMEESRAIEAELDIILKREGIVAKDGIRVLNAANELEYDWMKDSAGKPGVITIATNIAGRGTDIGLGRKMTIAHFDEMLKRGAIDQAAYARYVEAKDGKPTLTPEGKDYDKNRIDSVGGLRQINYGVNDSLRIDMQASGRAGRMGAAGESFTLVATDEASSDYTFIQRGLMSGNRVQQAIAKVAMARLNDPFTEGGRFFAKWFLSSGLKGVDLSEVKTIGEWAYRIAQRNVEIQNAKSLFEAARRGDRLFTGQLLVKPIFDYLQEKIRTEVRSQYKGGVPEAISTRVNEVFNSFKEPYTVEELKEDLDAGFVSKEDFSKYALEVEDLSGVKTFVFTDAGVAFAATQKDSLERLGNLLDRKFGIRLNFEELGKVNMQALETAVAQELMYHYASSAMEERLSEIRGDFFKEIQKEGPKATSRFAWLAEQRYTKMFTKALMSMAERGPGVIRNMDLSGEKLNDYVNNAITSREDTKEKEVEKAARVKDAEKSEEKNEGFLGAYLTRLADVVEAAKKAEERGEFQLEAEAKAKVALKEKVALWRAALGIGVTLQRTFRDSAAVEQSLTRQAEQQQITIDAAVLARAAAAAKDGSAQAQAHVQALNEQMNARREAVIARLRKGEIQAAIIQTDKGFEVFVMPVSGDPKPVVLQKVTPEYYSAIKALERSDGKTTYTHNGKELPVKVSSAGVIEIGEVHYPADATIGKGTILINSELEGTKPTIGVGAYIEGSVLNNATIGDHAVIKVTRANQSIDAGAYAKLDHVYGDKITVGDNGTVVYSARETIKVPSGAARVGDFKEMGIFGFKASDAERTVISSDTYVADQRGLSVFVQDVVGKVLGKWRFERLKKFFERLSEELAKRTDTQLLRADVKARRVGGAPDEPEVAGQAKQQLSVEEVLAHAEAMKIMASNANEARDILGKLSPRQKLIVIAIIAFQGRRDANGQPLLTEENLKYFEGSEILTERVKDMPGVWGKLKDHNLPNVPFIYIKLSGSALKLLQAKNIQSETAIGFRTSPYDIAILGQFLSGSAAPILKEVWNDLLPFIAAGSITVNGPMAKENKEKGFEMVAHEYGHHIDAGKNMTESSSREKLAAQGFQVDHPALTKLLADLDAIKAPYVSRSTEDVNLIEEPAQYRLQNLGQNGEFPGFGKDRGTVLTYAYQDDGKTPHAKTPEHLEKLNAVMTVIERLDRIFPGRVVTHMIRRARSVGEILGWTKGADGSTLTDEELFDRHLPHFTKEEISRAKAAGYDTRQIALMEMDEEAREHGYIRHDLADPTPENIQKWANNWAVQKVTYLWNEGGEKEQQLIRQWLSSSDAVLRTATEEAMKALSITESMLPAKTAQTEAVTTVAPVDSKASFTSLGFGPQWAEWFSDSAVQFSKAADSTSRESAVHTAISDLAGKLFNLDTAGLNINFSSSNTDPNLRGKVGYFSNGTITINRSRLSEIESAEMTNQAELEKYCNMVMDMTAVLVHEAEHAKEPANMEGVRSEVRAYAETAEAMRALDGLNHGSRYARQIELIDLLLSVLADGRRLDTKVPADVLQLVEQIVSGSADPRLGLESLLNRLNAQIYALGNSGLNAQRNVKILKDAAEVKSLIDSKLKKDAANLIEHHVFVTSEADANVAEMRSEIARLQSLGFMVFKFDDAVIRGIFGNKADPYDAIYRLTELAAALGQTQFVKLMAQYEVRPQVDGKFYSIAACFSSPVIKGLITELVSHQQVASAA